MKISTLRSKKFRIVKLTGNTTMISHDNPFTVNQKPARKVSNGYEFIINGQYFGSIPRTIELKG